MSDNSDNKAAIRRCAASLLQERFSVRERIKKDHDDEPDVLQAKLREYDSELGKAQLAKAIAEESAWREGQAAIRSIRQQLEAANDDLERDLRDLRRFVANMEAATKAAELAKELAEKTLDNDR